VTETDRADLARAVARVVAAVPGVTRLVGDARPVEVATLYRHGKILGVRLTERTVSVHVAVDLLPVQVVTEAIGQAVRQLLCETADDREITVVVDQLDGIDALPERGSARETSP
jgi:hypothetical protein